jgi:glycosyltransferase involved in cell wall biosynthesis
LAINYKGEFVDKRIIPWQQQPAKLLDPDDPHGIKMFKQALMRNQYDIVWVCNDIYVTQNATNDLVKIRAEIQSRGHPSPVFIYYYPVDCHVDVESSSFVEFVDVPVCYSNHGKEETLKALPHLKDRLQEVPHGVDTRLYFPLTKGKIDEFKQEFLRVGPDTTVVINVNRNNPRKQIPYSILAFKEFKKHVPDSVMYIHAAPNDIGGLIPLAIRDAGLDFSKDVVFPTKYGPSNPFPPDTMNGIYNMADMFLTTHLGEGWGLTVTEAMACGVPVIAPRNTSMPQQLGENSERGYLYKCHDTIWIDNSGYRPKGLLPDIVDKMIEVHRAGPKKDNIKVGAALRWAREHDWRKVAKQWVDVCERGLHRVRASTTQTSQLVAEEL